VPERSVDEGEHGLGDLVEHGRAQCGFGQDQRGALAQLVVLPGTQGGELLA
jgi:hypothetical protein